MIIKEVFIPKLKLTIVFHIGQNAQDNFDIIDISLSGGHINDIWFHVKDVSSSHVIARVHQHNLKRKELHPIIIQGAELCKRHSKYKSDKNVEIIYTEIKNVEKTETIGCVIAENTKNVLI